MSNLGPATKRMYVGPGHMNEEWTDILQPSRPSVLIDKRGYGDFPVDGMSVSVWVDSAAAGAANLSENLYVHPSRRSLPILCMWLTAPFFIAISTFTTHSQLAGLRDEFSARPASI